MPISESILYDVFRKERDKVFISEKALAELYSKKFRFVYAPNGKELYIVMDDEKDNMLDGSDEAKSIPIAKDDLFKTLNAQKSKLMAEVPKDLTVLKNEADNSIVCKKSSKKFLWNQLPDGRWVKNTDQ